MVLLYFIAILIVIWIAMAWLPNYRQVRRLDWAALSKLQKSRFMLGSVLLASAVFVWVFLMYYSIASFYRATFTNAPKPFILIILVIGGYLFYFLNAAAGGFLRGLSNSETTIDRDENIDTIP